MTASDVITWEGTIFFGLAIVALAALVCVLIIEVFKGEGK